ncbi:acetoacetate--CoA ligase [Modestobacter sp. I12A-02628]|uniref:Acetoacetate--CoA ligase n=1 Tax=Goekera deserti TaxID=2497753 RepID=A0A7K3WGI7_9ACTN|nr:acetoacetate--CoA ligase [Goekera deserti]MPQ99445.1 acetoacetate--CoA ligase [Goekera deserti]NDI48932.1 acetoacetate--CoA ligase [Goekera deserti]NEL55598.1 acetoacetate--CoA ligase [Goekera deserti]
MTTTSAPGTGIGPGPAAETRLASFRRYCAQRTGRPLERPGDLHAFSLDDAPTFWRALLEWSALPWSGSADRVVVGTDVETARFFPDVRLNYAAALLGPRPDVDDASAAVTSVHADGSTRTVDRRGLRAAVGQAAAALRRLGVRPGEQVVVVAGSDLPTVVAVLAAAAVGATVSTAMPDMGAPVLVDRFGRTDPVLLFLDRAAVPGDADAAGHALVSGLPGLRHVLLLDDGAAPERWPVDTRSWAGELTGVPAEPVERWPALPFDHPLFVLFSSGTTGPPKAIVHGAGGTLLEHVKEHALHGDLGPRDVLYVHTTTAWMMWHWQLSALAVGAHVVLYDGPVSRPATLWELVARHGVTVFGTSPAHLQLCQDTGLRPGETLDLGRLRAVLSTGSVLHDWQFDWVADAVGPVPLQSISGGTDVLGCFVLGHPELPVRRGWSQARSLGLDVAAVDEAGREVRGRVGELVCRRPFPSRPVGFRQDPDGRRFHDAYFAAHPGMWTHGDLVEIAPDGGARVHGRSDGVLNVDGVRIGPSEVYRALQGVPGIAQAMAVEQRDPRYAGASRMVLLVVLHPDADLDGDLARTLRATVRRRASAAHVPSLVVAVDELPVTHSGKPSETAARDAVNGDPVRNEGALRNPGCLTGIRAAVARAGRSTVPTADADARALTTSAAADADADRVAAEAARLWREALGLDRVGPDDHFADLGGTSRQVMTLLRRVALELGADVPVEDFLAEPTPAGLARCVARARSAPMPDVVELRAGVGRPVFLLCDAWGQFNSLHALVRALHTERPVLGLHPPLADAAGRRRSVGELADACLVAAAGRQPAGPLSLLGYSFGGLVGYETAVRARAAGRPLGWLGLIDVFPPTASLTRGEARARRWAGRLDTLRSPARLAHRLHHRVPGVGQGVEEAAWTQSWLVAAAHRLSPYDGPVTYYAATRGLPLVGNTLSAWRRAAPHLLVTELAGDHEDLLSAARVDLLAARVSATLA